MNPLPPPVLGELFVGLKRAESAHDEATQVRGMTYFEMAALAYLQVLTRTVLTVVAGMAETAPHRFEGPHGGYCWRCGRLGRDAAHTLPADYSVGHGPEAA